MRIALFVAGALLGLPLVFGRFIAQTVAAYRGEPEPRWWAWVAFVLLIAALWPTKKRRSS